MLSDAADASSYTYTIDGVVATPEQISNYLMLSVNDTPIIDLDIAHEFTVSDGTNT